MKILITLLLLPLIICLQVRGQLPSLYYLAGNQVSLSDIGINFPSPGLVVQGATIFAGEGTNDLVLVPKAKLVTISGKWKENGHDTLLKLKVIRPPRATIKYILDGEEMANPKMVQEGRCILTLSPDDTFAKQCPLDTMYFFKSPMLNFQLTLNAKIIQMPMYLEGSEYSPKLNYVKMVGSIEKEWIEIEGIYRRNIEGEMIKEALGKRELTITFR